MFYADDLCQMAPSAVGLQLLISVCEKYGVEYDILYNPIKFKYMTVLPIYAQNSIRQIKRCITLIYTKLY